MIPGSVVFHTRFPFRDTETPGRKLAVILNDGSCGRFVAVKTTSKGYRYALEYGCQPPPSAKFPCYFIPEHVQLFPKDTWIQLHEFFSFDVTEFRTGHRQGISLPRITIPNRFLVPLIECALQSDDLSGENEKVLDATLSQIT